MSLLTSAPTLVFVALGSNLGDSRRTILDAMARLQEFSGQPILKSSLWQTTPVNCPPNSPLFVNAVVGFAPQKNETPESLLQKLRALEKDFGRPPKKVLNEPRALDLDLIAHLRRFVLRPLSEIAPDLILPGQSKTISQVLAELAGEEIVTRLDATPPTGRPGNDSGRASKRIDD
jgi:2-amino-4-hydroxy-6-hydroxymethyldihydropteridine diphosphokinase